MSVQQPLNHMLPSEVVGDSCYGSAVIALQVVQACLQAASALHANQLVHRDFRHPNVL